MKCDLSKAKQRCKKAGGSTSNSLVLPLSWNFIYLFFKDKTTAGVLVGVQYMGMQKVIICKQTQGTWQHPPPPPTASTANTITPAILALTPRPGA
jgi:hypothetical protein